MSTIINPKTGRAFTRSEIAQLGEHQSKAHLFSVRTPTSQQTIAAGLTPGKLASVLRSALSGNPSDFFILAEEIEERDLHYRSVLSTRKLAVASIDPTVEAASDDEHDVMLAEEVRKLLKHPNMPECCFDLLDGLGKGIGLVEILWDTEVIPWKPKDYLWVDPRFIRLDQETYNEVRLVTDQEPFEGEPLKPNGYLCHQPRMKSGHFIRNGLARLVAVMYMLKSYTVRDWWAFAEVFGMPIRVGKYHANASEEDIKTLVSAIATLASDAGAAIPESMQIDMVETAKGNGGDTLFENMAEWADRQISKGVLGQTMTSDDGSSQSQATVHNEVRKDIIKWDARQLANTLNEFLVKPFIDMNWGKQEQYPCIKIELEEAEDTKAWVDALVPLVDRGLQVQMSDVRDKLKLSDPDKGAELLVPLSQTASPELGLNRQQVPFKLALNRQQPIKSDVEIDEFTEQALEDWEEVSAPMLNPILALAQSAESFEQFAEQLPELASQMEGTEFIEQLTRLSFQARALGNVSDD
ncbi:DUF935 domain-containing protein [Vibrio europaeus]|uniref:DUF935 domain-containing protein n=1 Tax=Vibrio europaeus TaxID=300876 RepID=UPI00233EF630|nr:DUF935 domain-containing protein [Vibrio europaeus]MDC5753850.1 DUF935 domain-containing protein [Vibrio europaeus]MDC5776762.1 DUF935 domain-containing protein [Vibrio europaeus]MDC5796778.1 DUF935 domain-containing protein [Vibrio europaeus]MDC5801775.1 DUF935 domain-containing protein [Vibrio europaeus]MDC5815748.1 DUF935 domain-containing protein [Vibrio europaeus]